MLMTSTGYLAPYVRGGGKAAVSASIDRFLDAAAMGSSPERQTRTQVMGLLIIIQGPQEMSNTDFNPKVDSYIENAEEFARPILEHLRKLIHATCPEVIEEMKWGIPHFDYKGEMMCIFAAYKKHCSFSFWKDALMSDARLVANSELPAVKRFMGKLTRVADLPSDSELISWIKEAVELNERGAKLPPRKSEGPKEVRVSEAFSERLAVNPSIKAIFESKSPSFQKEYNVWIAEAKTDATRDKRIEEALAWIADGKGRFWKYAKTH